MTAIDARSLLFLSCDLVGSTRFKQQVELWHGTFLSFYREFPQVLGELTEKEVYEPGFQLWKPVGDELIFTSHVRSEKDIFRAVRIWLKAMSIYEDDSLEGVALTTKGGAFVATFPGPDSESSIPRDPTIERSDKGIVELNDEALAARSNDYMYDYFGPSIDTGFRVVSACSNRYFTLSVEVAWAMAQCTTDAGVDTAAFPLQDLKLLDTREFKGVWDGREYPLFALDRHHTDHVNVALTAIRQDGVEAVRVVNLCRACAAMADWPSKLYLPDSTHPAFQSLPEDSLDSLRSNSMEGAETVPSDSVGTQDLEENPPLPQPVSTKPAEPATSDVEGATGIRPKRT